MSKSDYWNEKENEKYLKMKAGIEGQELDFKSVKKVSEISNIWKILWSQWRFRWINKN